MHRFPIGGARTALALLVACAGLPVAAQSPTPAAPAQSAQSAQSAPSSAPPTTTTVPPTAVETQAPPAVAPLPSPAVPAIATPRSTAPVSQRPKIGLALSGGGARGMAHIGVLKVLDELKVPVHCVTGTSMGAIVGGSFAAGMNARIMESVVRRTDWSAVFDDRPPRGEIASRRKRDDYKGFFAPEFGFRDWSLLLPKGLLAGVSVESFLRSLTATVANVQDFRQLPIPFRAVATDIETGQAVILDKGSLPLAMRASMAIPGAMSPVEIDDRMLVDGGIANNLPIDLVRQMCGEVVIAVNISTEPMKRKDISSALSIVGQLINFLGKESVDKQLASLGDRDVLIQPDLGDITSSSFERSADAIRIGEAAARQMADALARYSLPADEYAGLRIRQTTERVATVGRFDAITFEGLKRSNSAILAQLIETRPGDLVTEEALARDLRRIYGRGDFESVDYRIEEGPGGRALVIQAREKEIGPDYMRMGLSLATDFQGGNYFNALASYRRTWLNSLGAEWVVEGQIGKSSYLFTELMQPLRQDGDWFVAPYASIGKRYRPVFVGDVRAAEYERREGILGLDLGKTLGQWGEVRLGPQYRKVSARVTTGPNVPGFDETASGMRLSLFGDRFDGPWFPRDGHRFQVSVFSALTAFNAERSYTRAEASLGKAFTWKDHTLEFAFAGGTAFGTALPFHDPFLLGGPFRLSAYAINQFAGERMAFGEVRYVNRIRQLPNPIGSGVYGGVSLEAARMDRLYDGRETTGNLWSTALFIGAETFLGPAWVGLGLAPGGTRSLFLTVGVP
jgi:NTE family protein